MPFIEEKIGQESLIWLKINPRHKTIHLLPFHRKETLCGISYKAGTFYPDEGFVKCGQCQELFEKYSEKYREKIGRAHV